MASVGDFTQIPVGPNPVQICPPLGDGSTVNVYNQDLNNVVTVSRNNSVAFGAGNGAPIQPLTNAVLDASKALYAVAPAGTASLVIIPQGGTLSPSPAQIAAQIAISGVSLLVKSTPLGSVKVPTGLAGGGGTTTILNAVPISQVGYEFSFTAQQNSAANVFPLIEIALTWSDSVTGQVTAVDHFYTSASTQASATALITVGTGPTKGDTLTVVLTNTNASPVNYTFTAAQNGRVYNRDDWHWIGYKGQAGTTRLSAVTDPQYSETEQNLLVNHFNTTIAATTSLTVQMPLWCGNVWVHVDETGVAPANMEFAIVTQTAFSNGVSLIQPVYASGVGGGPTGANPNGPINVLVALPRSPCSFILTNNGSVSATNVSTEIIVAEQPT